MPIHYTRGLIILQEFIEETGVKVNLFARLEGRVGRIDYQEKRIDICTGSSKTALLTLIHESGHWLAYIRSKEDLEKRCTKKEREIKAYLYGWALIKHLNLVVKKNEWVEEEYENIRQY